MRFKKVIVIGQQKSGTSSLAAALELLGIRCRHFDYQCLSPSWSRWKTPQSHVFLPPFSGGIPALTRDGFDAVADAPVYAEPFLEWAVDTYGDEALFVQIDREPASWIRSVLKHHNSVICRKLIAHRRRTFTNYDPEVDRVFTCDGVGLAEWLYGVPLQRLDEQILSRAHDRHLSRVEKLFRGRHNFVRVPIGLKSDRDKWGLLCECLRLDVPALPFPHANTTARSSRRGWLTWIKESPGVQGLRHARNRILKKP